MRSLTLPCRCALLHTAPAAEQLIAKAQAVHAGDTGIQDESVLSPEFKFEFPIVK